MIWPARFWHIVGRGALDAPASGGSSDSFILREDGSFLLREDGSKFVRETVAPDSFILREDGSFLLREDGFKFVRETGASSVRIMPLGDSITQGQNTAYGSYRRLLYSELIAAGVNVDFVGGLQDPTGDVTFLDSQHEGHTGEEIVSIWARIQTGGVLFTYTPDIILLLIGTNDIWHGADPSPATALTMLDNLLTSIPLYGGATTKVIVGSIPPIDVSVAGSTVSSNVNVYNAGIPALVASKGANFSFVDINAALTTSDLADGVHPTDAGNDKIAPVWFAGIQTALGVHVGPFIDENGVTSWIDDNSVTSWIDDNGVVG